MPITDEELKDSRGIARIAEGPFLGLEAGTRVIVAKDIGIPRSDSGGLTKNQFTHRAMAIIPTGQYDTTSIGVNLENLDPDIAN